MFDALWGMQIIESEWISEIVKCEVVRNFRERWLSWPWMPWVKTKTVTYRMPLEDIYMIGNNVFCHPAIAVRLRNVLVLSRGEHNTKVVE